MVQLAANIWADGPASAPYQPPKNDIRDWGTWVEGIINAFTSTGGLIYTSRAALYADLAHAANSMAWVLGDATVAFNGIYLKSGVSGSGAWSRVGDLPYSFIVATDAGAGTANAIQATSPIPTSASALVITSIYRVNTGSPVTISFNGAAPVTIKTNTGNDIAPGGLPAGMQILGYISGSTYRLVNDQVSSAIVAAAEAQAVAAAASAVTAANYAALARNDRVARAYIGDGVTTDFALPVDPGSINNVTVNLNGTPQFKSACTLVYVGTSPVVPTLRFTEAPTLGLPFEAEMGYAVSMPTPGTATVGTTQLADNSVTTAKIVDKAITLAKQADIATASIMGRKSAGTGSQEILSGADVRDNITPAGAVIDRAYNEYVTNAAITALIPLDDTVPQNTEGTQILSATITPKSITNRLRIRVSVVGTTIATSAMIATVFSDLSANALSARYVTIDTANFEREINFEVEFVPASTSARTITCRVGPGSGTTVYMNGNASGRIFGGVSKCTLIVEEIKA